MSPTQIVGNSQTTYEKLTYMKPPLEASEHCMAVCGSEFHMCLPSIRPRVDPHNYSHPQQVPTASLHCYQLLHAPFPSSSQVLA